MDKNFMVPGRMRIFKSYSLEKLTEKFWGKVDKNGDCWIWNGAKTKEGYGGAYAFGKFIKSHRLAYILEKGEIPEGMVVMHACDNPSCVRPEHLSLGTQRDNILDAIKKGRWAPLWNGGVRKAPAYGLGGTIFCKRGHDVSLPASVYYHPNRGAMCRQCKNDHATAWRKEKSNGKSKRKGRQENAPQR